MADREEAAGSSDTTVEIGNVSFEQVATRYQTVDEAIKERNSRVSQWLAFLLAGGLLFLITLHYVTLLSCNNCSPEKLASLSEFFNTALPVLAGLTGTAVAYFLTKDR